MVFGRILFTAFDSNPVAAGVGGVKIDDLLEEPPQAASSELTPADVAQMFKIETQKNARTAGIAANQAQQMLRPAYDLARKAHENYVNSQLYAVRASIDAITSKPLLEDIDALAKNLIPLPSDPYTNDILPSHFSVRWVDPKQVNLDISRGKAWPPRNELVSSDTPLADDKVEDNYIHRDLWPYPPETPSGGPDSQSAPPTNLTYTFPVPHWL